ncbi:OmpA family protein [Microbulbifer sp. OS29]|uniref:OmpA family protein n=1 Tax=Microbulbifer okhotskensis TaxID=2926617 RepID=A0A9X2ENI9_9GAMM|nr:OmpA family protein [Microbulbifer okhotskensis]MCO1335494.1 OmpA family protein [Microbulbifer okhotskensis]
MAGKLLSASCLTLLAITLAGCHQSESPKKYTLEPVDGIQTGDSEKTAREAAPFADELVRFLRGNSRASGDTFRLRLEFQPGGFAPRIETIADLEALLVIMRDFVDMRIAIEGHTDNAGDAEKNLSLSQRRADWVKYFLIERGVSADRMEAQGYGDTDPIGDNETKKGKRENRRLMIRVLNFDHIPSQLPRR